MSEKKDSFVQVRLPEKMKRMIAEQAEKDVRTINEEVMYLIALGLHAKKFTPKDYC